MLNLIWQRSIFYFFLMIFFLIKLNANQFIKIILNLATQQL